MIGPLHLEENTQVCILLQAERFKITALLEELQFLEWPLGHKALLYQMIKPQHVNIRTIILKVLHI